MSNDDLLSVTQAAALLNLRPDSLRQVILRERLPAQKVGNSWVIRRADLETYRQTRRLAGRPRRTPGDHA